MPMTPLRPQSTLFLAASVLLLAGLAFSQDKPDRPPWTQKRKSTASGDPTSKPSSTSTSTTSPSSTPDGEPGKTVQPTPGAPKDESQDAASQRGRIRVNVNLVNVLVSVLDEKNRPAPDLPREAFQLFEEGVEQKIDKFEPETSQPLDLAIMIDSSISAHKQITFEQEAAAHFRSEERRVGKGCAVW